MLIEPSARAHRCSHALPCPALSGYLLPESPVVVTTLVPLDQISDPQRGGVISIGNFDGVHRGHAELLREVRRQADQLGGPAVAVVLDPHPASLLRPERAPERLSWIELRAERMAEHKIDYLVVCRTSKEFLQLSAQRFFDWLIRRELAARAMVEGPNFFFGRDRGGDVKLLEDLCRSANIQLSIVQPTLARDEMISSTRIRGLLDEGEVAEAAGLLGAPHRIRGRVSDGAKRGRQIGFPTANLSEVDVLCPAEGVYGGFAIVGEQRYQAAIHIGSTPTFAADRDPTIEVHLLDFNADLYGELLLVDFAVRVRDVARFDSTDRLVDQLKRDIVTVREQLASCS